MHIFTVISYFYWYQTFMKFIRDFFVPKMELLWNLFGTFLEFLWDFNVKFLWHFFGTPMVIWLPKKFNVEFLWNFFGIYLDHFYLLGGKSLGPWPSRAKLNTNESIFRSGQKMTWPETKLRNFCLRILKPRTLIQKCKKSLKTAPFIFTLSFVKEKFSKRETNFCIRFPGILIWLSSCPWALKRDSCENTMKEMSLVRENTRSRWWSVVKWSEVEWSGA